MYETFYVKTAFCVFFKTGTKLSKIRYSSLFVQQIYQDPFGLILISSIQVCTP